jgi:proteasome lid subunit RPN8/RPN11
LTCRRKLWSKLLHDLRARGGDVRESGAFLLGRERNGRHEIVDYMLYDDVDPDALRGMIVFDGSRMDLVWEVCERRGLKVVADVHTHPGGYGQSGIDQAHPMIPQRGHIAMIVPRFADRVYMPGEIGIYELRGAGHWRDHSADGAAFFKLGGGW